MFGLFKSKAPQSDNGLFLITVKIGRGSNAQMPQNLKGAYVPAFAAAVDHEAAAKAAVAKLVAQGFEFLDIDGPIKQLDPGQWSAFVHASFPELENHFPNQQTVVAGLAEGAVFFGPFASYEQSA